MPASHSDRPHPRERPFALHTLRRTLTIAVIAALPMLAAGCVSDSWAQSRPAPSPVGELGQGFWPEQAPAPGQTVSPSPGSWQSVHPAAGYRVLLLVQGTDSATQTLVGSVTNWAKDESVDLRRVDAVDDPVDDIDQAVTAHADLIITAGNSLVDALSLVTASHLEQQFLLLGTELPEPTSNVTAVTWTGASYRGNSVDSGSAFAPETFTQTRAADAVRAGTVAVFHGKTGVVIALD